MKIRRRHLEAGAPVVAMADIAFNLVLFFIILARTQDDSNLRWKPAGAPKVEAIEQSRVVVTVDEDSKVYLNGVPAEDVLRKAMAEVVGTNEVDEGRVRITITGGPSPLGSDRGSAGPTLLVAATLMFLSQSETYSSMNYRLMSQARYAAESHINYSRKELFLVRMVDARHRTRQSCARRNLVCRCAE